MQPSTRITILGANLGHGFQIWAFINSLIPFRGLSLAVSWGKKLYGTNKELSRGVKIVEKKSGTRNWPYPELLFYFLAELKVLKVSS